LSFSIGFHKKDKVLLELLQLSLGVGSITNNRNNGLQYRVYSLDDLAVIIDHFVFKEKYPLITQKRTDYELFKQVFELVKSKQHLTKEDLHKNLAIKASMNRGLSPELKAAFSDVKPVPRSIVENQEIKDPNWIAGFSTGEACFFIDI
jgi:hypothetical protein